MTARILTALALRLDRAGESLHRVARRLRGEPEPDGPHVCPGCFAVAEPDGPHVCPGCFAVAEPCAPWCVDAEMRREDEERDYADGDDEVARDLPF